MKKVALFATVAVLALAIEARAETVQLLISGTEGHAVVVDNHLYYRSKHLPDSDSKEPMTNLPRAHAVPMLQFLNALAGAKDQILAALALVGTD